MIYGCRINLVDKNTNVAACDDAIDGRNYDLALEKCASSRSDLVAAHLGKGGFDFINFAKASLGKKLTDSTSGGLGGLDRQGTFWLSIIGASSSKIASPSERLSTINTSIGHFESARNLIYESDRTTLLTDTLASEAVLGIFANILLLQLNKTKDYDRGEGLQNVDNGVLGVQDNCASPTDATNAGNTYYNGANIPALAAYDGYLWGAERNFGYCLMIPNDAADNNAATRAACQRQGVILNYTIAIKNALTKVTSKVPVAIDNAQESACLVLDKVGCFSSGALSTSACAQYL